MADKTRRQSKFVLSAGAPRAPCLKFEQRRERRGPSKLWRREYGVARDSLGHASTDTSAGEASKEYQEAHGQILCFHRAKGWSSRRGSARSLSVSDVDCCRSAAKRLEMGRGERAAEGVKRTVALIIVVQYRTAMSTHGQLRAQWLLLYLHDPSCLTELIRRVKYLVHQ